IAVRTPSRARPVPTLPAKPPTNRVKLVTRLSGVSIWSGYRSAPTRPITTACSTSGAAARRDLAGVEAEPVHAAQVARVLDLHAAVDDDLQPGPLGDLRALGADHAELEPERAGAGVDRLARDPRHGVGRAEDVDDVR